MSVLQRIKPRWQGKRCVVAATGPSLTPKVAEAIRSEHIIAVNDAYRLIPWADVLYACDAHWWDHHGVPLFPNQLWSSHDDKLNPKLKCAKQYGLHLVAGRYGQGFSYDPSFIHYGSNSGFQAINLAILFGANRIVLVGFDMRGTEHFFGKHPPELRSNLNNLDFQRFIPEMRVAARGLPEHIKIVCATPSALDCFEYVPLSQEFGDAFARAS